MPTPITRNSAARLIKGSCRELRNDLNSEQRLNAVLDVLLWARWVPTSHEDAIGYFDAMRSPATAEQWAAIWGEIQKRSGLELSGQDSWSEAGMGRIEMLRAGLLPLGRAINKGDPQDCKALIEALLSIKEDDRSRIGGEWGGSRTMAYLWDALLASHPEEPVACLFPVGAAAAPMLGASHPLLLSHEPTALQSWTSALLSLYPGAKTPGRLEDQATWPVAIAGPAWNERTRELLVNDPWLSPHPLECPAAIRDNEARRIYAAHQRCEGTTYALVSAGVGFRTSQDLEFFREELVRKNWLEAVVALPAGAIGGVRAEGLMLILKHDRDPASPIQMATAHQLVSADNGRVGRIEWDCAEATALARLLHERDETATSRLVTAAELEANGFNLQPSRYLHSETDLLLQQYLASRETAQLGDLAEIKRPVASLGRQEADGIEVREVTPWDIDESGQLRQGSKSIRLPEAALARGRQQLLESGDVLLSIKGGLGKVAVVQDLEEPTVPGQAFCVVRLRPNAPLTPSALVQYLRSTVGQALLAKAGQGTAVAFVPMGEVKGLPIVIPRTKELQRAEAVELESVELSRKVADLARRLAELAQRGWMDDLPQALISEEAGLRS